MQSIPKETESIFEVNLTGNANFYFATSNKGNILLKNNEDKTVIKVYSSQLETSAIQIATLTGIRELAHELNIAQNLKDNQQAKPVEQTIEDDKNLEELSAANRALIESLAHAIKAATYIQIGLRKLMLGE